MSAATAACADPVLVSDGETRQALALVRALGRRGLRVDVLAARRGSLAGSSRFANAEHPVPDVEDRPAAWAAAVRALLEREPTTLFVPTTEAALGTAYREGLCDRARVAAPPRDAYELACDKPQLLALAEATGLRVPRSLLVEAPERLDELPAGFAFPVVLKARRSRFFADARWQRGPALQVGDLASLRRAVRAPGLRAGALLQSYVPGGGEGLFFAADRGRILAAFAHRRVREKPPTGGVGTLVESIAVDPALLERAQRLALRLGWHGVAMLELRRTPQGEAVVMELNPRLWGSLQLAVDAGADFPGWLLALHAGGPAPSWDPRPGVRLRWLLGDLDRLLVMWRRAPVRRALGTTRRAAFVEFLAGFGGGARLETLRRDDPRPFLSELASWVRALPRAMP